MYYVPINKNDTFKHFYFIMFSGAISFFASIFLATYPWISILWIGFLAFILNYILSRLTFKGPGIFFILMINGMLSSLTNIPLLNRIYMVFYVLIGVLIAYFLILFENKLYENNSISVSIFEISYANKTNSEINEIIIKSLINSIFIFIAYYVGYNLQLKNYYWVLVASIVVLQEETIQNAFKKQIMYILAAISGCIISFIIYSYINNILVLVLIACVLMFLICYFMPKNYLIGNLFTTPIALILFRLFNPNTATDLIYSRIINILIGTCIGIIGIIVFSRFQRTIDKHKI